MITKPTSFVKPKTETLKETEFDKKANLNRSNSKKVKGNFSSSSVSKEKVQGMFKADKYKTYQKISLNAEKIRRNFTENSKRRDGNQSFLTDYYSSFNKVYDLYSKQNKDWIKEFLDMMSYERSIDISSLIPNLKENVGEILLLNSKFWVLFIEFKKSSSSPKLTFDNCIEIFNECLKYEINDIKLIYEFFLKVLSSFGRKFIFEKIKKSNFSDKIPDKYDDFTIKHYKFILDYPNHFSEETLKAVNTGNNMGKRSKLVQSSTNEKDESSKRNKENFSLLTKRNSVKIDPNPIIKERLVEKEKPIISKELVIVSVSFSINKDEKVEDLIVSSNIEMSINSIKPEFKMFQVKENSFLINENTQKRNVFKEEYLIIATEFQETFCKESDKPEEECEVMSSMRKEKKYRSRNKSKRSKVSITEESDEEKNSEKEDKSSDEIEVSKKKTKRKYKRNKKNN